MADNTELRMNVAALKRVDPYVKDILDSATHVALYTFNSETNAWEKTDVEGALFVYGRNGEPYHGIVIMNRLNTNNLVEPVSNGLDFQLQEPFLLYRNAKSRIYGVWFYDKDECIRIASVLDKLVKELDKKHDKSPKVKKGNPIDIYSMLSKAQEDFNVSKVKLKNNFSEMGANKSAPPKGVNAEHSKPDSTPQSVMEFFAKASTSQYSVDNDECKGLKQVRSGLFLNQAPAIGLPTPVACPNVVDSNGVPLKPLIQRLMSNPAHSVEHIEKQQRSVTPESKKKERHPVKNGTKVLSSSLNCNTVPTKLIEKVDEGVSFLRVASPSPPDGMIAAPNVGNAAATVGELTGIDRPLSAPLCSDSTGKPALMPPVMFTSARVTSKAAVGDTSCISQVQSSPNLIKPSILGGTVHPLQENSDGLVTDLSPLTRNQLLQAFTYLIRHDPEFVNKLHEAYVKSFSEMIS
ncbi:mRNA-decapping enzyme 1A [Ischnura elegans]|uniref:mRNA-decapping enzyme 1A n=1 Tax=Ischnura elegans TaxID=197161 RepID=UPI001ED8A00D|nr:mRNA-decapping enzyme 1A [Ischnura elegans]